MNTYLIFYASKDFISRGKACAEEASKSGYSRVKLYGREDIEGTEFYSENSGILNNVRGDGYWLWKPYIIYQFLSRMEQGDALVYSDIGRSSYFRSVQPPYNLINHMQLNSIEFMPGVSIPHLGPIKQWTKSDCIFLMNATEQIIEKPMIQASWSVWFKTPKSMNFLEKWLSYCKDSRCLTDATNVLGVQNARCFIDHRHDQSILSILTHLTGSEYLDFTDSVTYKILASRPRSGLSQSFFKSLYNCDSLLVADKFWTLPLEYIKYRFASK